MKHSLNREELIEQLKELAAQKLPTYLANHMGAMCYEPSMIDSFSTICQHCHRPLTYQAFHSDEKMFNSIIKEIKDLEYDASLEVICGSCALEAKEEAEFFDLPLLPKMISVRKMHTIFSASRQKATRTIIKL